MSAAAHSAPTRLLHAALAAAVVIQLATSLVMVRPRGGRPGDLLWRGHEVVGLASLGVLLAFWIWTLVRQRETAVGRLWPWFSARRRRAVLDDAGDLLAAARQLRLPEPGDQPFASAMHGLGLLAALAMALTGAVDLVPGVPSGLLRVDLDLHSALANLMWAYLLAHAALALLHEATGHRLLGGMFSGAAPVRPAEDP